MALLKKCQPTAEKKIRYRGISAFFKQGHPQHITLSARFLSHCVEHLKKHPKKAGISAEQFVEKGKQPVSQDTFYIFSGGGGLSPPPQAVKKVFLTA